MNSRPPRPTRRSVTPIALALALASGAALAETIYRSTAPDGTVVFSDRPAPDATVVEPSPLNVVSPDDAAPGGGSGTGTGVPAAGDARAGARTGEPPPATSVPGAAERRAFGPEGDAAAVGSLAPIAPGVAPESGGDAAPDPGARDAGPNPAAPDALPAAAAATPAPAPPNGIERVVIASPPPDATLLDAAGPLIVEIGTSPGPLSASGLGAEVLLDGEVVVTGTSSMLAVPAPERGEHRLQVRLVDPTGRTVLTSEPQALHVRRDTVDAPLGTER